MPGVKVLVQNTATKEVQSAVTDSDGVYTFPALSGGTYQLRVERNDFRSFVQAGLAITPGSPLKADIRLIPDDTMSGGQDRPTRAPPHRNRSTARC